MVNFYFFMTITPTYGTMKDIDRYMFPILKMLDEMGFKTLYSCSGLWEDHPSQQAQFPYLVFEHDKRLPTKLEHWYINHRKSDNTVMFAMCPTYECIYYGEATTDFLIYIEEDKVLKRHWKELVDFFMDKFDKHCKSKCKNYGLTGVYGSMGCTLKLEPDTCGSMDPVPPHRCQEHAEYCYGDLFDCNLCKICGLDVNMRCNHRWIYKQFPKKMKRICIDCGKIENVQYNKTFEEVKAKFYVKKPIRHIPQR